MKRIISFLITIVLLAGIITVPGVTSSAIEKIRTGTLVSFGSYPQSRVKYNVLIDELNSLPLSWTDYDFYCDGKLEIAMKYTDVNYSGNYYRGVSFTQINPSRPLSNDPFMYSPDYNINGEVYWFRYEPIVWRVLDAKNGLLLSEKVIDSQPFHNGYYQKKQDGEPYGEFYGDVNFSHYASDWEYSSLQRWLNNDFCNTAFGDEAEYILNTHLTTPSGVEKQYDAGETDDRVFLLTVDDVKNESYGFTAEHDDYQSSDEIGIESRIAYRTAYASCQGCNQPSYGEGGTSYWRLRTPFGSAGTGFVYFYGEVDSVAYTAWDRSVGIRPAVRVDIQSAVAQSLMETVESADSAVSDAPEFRKVTFGSYPQSRVTDPDLLKALRSISIEWKEYGSMKFADITYSDERYRAVTWTTDPNNGYKTGTVYWFKYEPIVWCVLDAGEGLPGLLMTEKLLDSQPFYSGETYYNEDYQKYYVDEEFQHYVTNWEYSTLRQWLNNDFFNTAFGEEKGYITDTGTGLTPGEYENKDGEPFTDKVFLLTAGDVIKEEYGFSAGHEDNGWGTPIYIGGPESNRVAYGTDYAKCRGLPVSDGINKDAATWLLRSYTEYFFAGVTIDKVRDDGQMYCYDSSDDENFCAFGVRPAVYVDLQDAIAEGVIKPADGTQTSADNPSGTSYSDTAPYDVEFRIDGYKGKTTLQFKQAWFSKDSKEYNHALATFCSKTAMLGYMEKEGDKNKNQTIKEKIKQLGFSNIEVKFNTRRDEVNYFIADRKITVNGENKLLIFMGFVGSYHLQWNSNFDPYGIEREYNDDRTAPYGDKSEKGVTHLGFLDAKEFVYEKLTKHIEKLNVDSSDIKLLITGHSRGAATANLLAADLIKGAEGDKGYEKFAEAENIYTYTFATPNVTKKKEKSNKRFDRIFNIVNPEDFVTKMLPSMGWKFGRYGTTYTLPSKTNDADYKKLLTKMQTYFMQFHGGKSYANYPSGEKAVYDIVRDMTKSVSGLEEYYDKEIRIQIGNIPKLTAFVFFEYGLCPMVNEVSDKGEAASFLLAILVTDILDNSVFSKIIRYFLRDQLLGILNKYILKASILGKSLELAGEDVAVFSENLLLVNEYFVHAHMMQTYCAYMCGLTKAELTAKRKGYKNTVNCPVDIEIYDNSTGEVVGKIVNNEVDAEIAAKDNSVVMSVEGDEKSYWLPGNGDYDVRLSGNDTGTMDLCMTAIDSEGEEIDRVNYFDVPLSKDTEYVAKYDSDTDLTQETVLADKKDVELKPDAKYSEEEVPKYNVSLEADGDGIVSGDMTVSAGDYVTVTATSDNAEFEGWYSGDQLISTEAEYRFRPTENITLVAKFVQKEEPDYIPGDVDGNGKVLANDARLALRASASLETLEGVAFLAADVDGNGKILANDARQILRFSAQLIEEFEKADK